jgi:5S rRNA maturation endonuclease (ribonuclease M5)
MSIPYILQNVLERLREVRQQHDGTWMARCPAHNDKEPSLHVSFQNNRILMHCFAGCSLDAICDALNIQPRDLFLHEELGGNHHHEEDGLTFEAFARAKCLQSELLRQAQVTQGSYQGKPAVLFRYRDTEGELQAVRYRIALTGDCFRWQKGAEPKKLAYGEWWLPQWREKGKRMVVLVEGESDALTLWQAGIPALGIAGANSLSEYHLKLLESFQVVVWQEPDSAGATFAQKACELFQNVRVIEPPDGIKDASELWLKHVTEHGDNARAIFKAQVRELLEQARQATSTQPRHNLDTTSNLTSTYRDNSVEVRLARTFTLQELKRAPAPEDSGENSLPFFGVSGIIRRGRTHLLAGKPRVGKTEALFRGGVLEWHEERILYLSEEGVADWRDRLSGFAEDELPEQCLVRLCAGESRENLLSEIQEGGYSVVVLDTLRGVWRLNDELHPSHVITDVSPLIDLQRRRGFTLIVLHHERKAEGEAFSDRFAGTNALSGAFDMLLSLSQKGEGNLILSYEGRTSRGGSLLLQWQDGNLRYVGEAETVEWRVLLQRVEAVLARAQEPLTTKQVREQIGEPQPSIRQIQRALQCLHENKQIQRVPKQDKPGATYRWFLQNVQPNLDSNHYIRRGEVCEAEQPWWATGEGVPEGEPEFIEVSEDERT